METRINLRELRKIHPDKPESCLRCRYFLGCKSYKIHGRYFYVPESVYDNIYLHIETENPKLDTPYKIILLVAMNPGIEEDKTNEILVGKSGRLLEKYVQEYLSDHIVYVTNAVKCYTPKDSLMKNSEIPLSHIRYCNDFLKNDIDWIQPDIIVALGKVASQALDLLGVEYTKCHHPSYILHGGSDDFTSDVLTRVDAELKNNLIKIPYSNCPIISISTLNIGLDFEWDYITGRIHTLGIADDVGCFSRNIKEDLKEILEPLVKDPDITIIGHDLARAEVLKILELGITDIKCQFMDTIVLLRELIDNRAEQGLKEFCYRHLLIEDYTKHIPKDIEYKEYMKEYSPDVAKICAADAWSSLYLWKCLKEDWKEEYDGKELARQADMDMILPTAVMMHKGIGLDMSKVEEHRGKLVNLVPELEDSFSKDYGIDISSPKEVLEIIRTRIDKECKDTTKETIQKLLDVDEDIGHIILLNTILDYRQKSKLVSTYLKPLPGLADSHGIIHSYIQISGANNGRPTYSSPNIANIPRRGYNMKDIFCSKFGKDGVLATLDASESEFRHFAYLSQDQWLIDNYSKGIGMHDTVAKEVGISRDNTKTLNFARLYYATPAKLKAVLLDAGLKGKDLDTKLKKYLKATQSMQVWQQKTIDESYDRGYVLSPDGRRGYRLTPNTIANYPVSSFSSYSNKRRLRWLFDRMREQNMVSHIWCDYYDSSELDIYLPELDRLREIIKDMPQEVPDILGYDIHLPLNIELKLHGFNWS